MLTDGTNWDSVWALTFDVTHEVEILTDGSWERLTSTVSSYNDQVPIQFVDSETTCWMSQWRVVLKWQPELTGLLTIEPRRPLQ